MNKCLIESDAEYFTEKANELQEALNGNTSKEEQQQILPETVTK